MTTIHANTAVRWSAAALAAMFSVGATPASAVEPVPGTEQYNLLKPHEDFIRFMQRPSASRDFDMYYGAGSSSCCNLNDGRANFEEAITDDEAIPYRIKITHTVSGLELDQPVWVDIPKKYVLTIEDAERICEPKREAAEAQGQKSTCISPTFNVLWAYDNSSYDQNAGIHRVEGKEYRPGEKVDHRDWRITTMYCYFPQPFAF